MTEEERKEVIDKLMAVANSIVGRPSGDQRDIATVGSIAALVFAITEAREQEFALLVIDKFTGPEDTPPAGPFSNTSH